jgi:Zn-dependent peptidase ImmA (M78 family)
MKQMEKKFLKLKNQKQRRRKESLKKHRKIVKNL